MNATTKHTVTLDREITALNVHTRTGQLLSNDLRIPGGTKLWRFLTYDLPDYGLDA